MQTAPEQPGNGISGRLKEWFRSGLWGVRLERLPAWKQLPLRALRVLTVAVTEFFGDQCLLRASALTFFTLLSVVPVFAVIFGFAKGFGLEKMLEAQLMERLAGQEQVLERILVFASNMLQKTRGGLMAGIGVALMFWSAVKVLGHLESSLNAMWRVPSQRSWYRRMSGYLTVMIVGPVLLLAAGGASVFVRTRLDAMSGQFGGFLTAMNPVFFQALKLGPLVMVCALFTLIYKSMPNTHVTARAALIGGVAAGTLYQAAQYLYIGFQVGVAQYNAIYGSFAALPLFFVWIQTSWVLVLFGAELSYAAQHADGYCQATGCSNIRPRDRRLHSLRIARLAACRFADGGSPLTAEQMAHRLELPARLVQELAADLRNSGILTETRLPGGKNPAFQPAFDIHRLTVHGVLAALDAQDGTGSSPSAGAADTAGPLTQALQEMDAAAAASPANRLLIDLPEDPDARRE
jgi:membrane protein